MKVKAFALMIGLLTMSYGGTLAYAHCEIPCGIYNDEMRFDLIKEHADTIEKSMKAIVELQQAAKPNYNQLVRWIENKDDHATKIQEIVSQYFMTQRIKPTDAQYNAKIKVLHEMLILAMKCKQTTDTQNVESLRGALKRFHMLYFGPASHSHAPKKTKTIPKKK